jgi:hypothetical protein
MADESSGFINQIGRNPESAGRLVGSLSAKNAEALKSYLDQQLRDANAGMENWSQNFARNVLVAQTSVTGFQGAAEKAFGSLSQGMTKQTAHTTLYSKSVSEGMEKALKSTVTAITSEAVVRAIYNTGLGFYFLAIQAYDQAAQAFQAAAVFGSVAGVAGAVGQAFSGSGAGTAAEPRASAAKGAASLPTAAAAPTSSSAPGGNLTVMVVGESQAASWLTHVINTGVEQQDLRLVASHTKRSAPAR